MTGPDPLPSTAELLHAYDQARPRSKQTTLGMSEVGGCRRRAGYTLAGQPRDRVDGNGLQAVLGTAIDDAVTAVLRGMIEAGELPPGSMVQAEVTYAGLTGHLDLFAPPVVRDTKSLGFGTQLDRYADIGPPRRHQWQIHLYAAALITAGHEVTRVELDYIDRGSGRTWQWAAPFDVQLVRDALRWLAYVRDTDPELLPRDHLPDSQTCQACPFRRVCWEEAAVPGRDLLSALYVDDPDAAKWAAQLKAARAASRDAEQAEKIARGALDALRPNDRGTADVAVPGMDKLLRWSHGRRESLDRARIEADYAEAGRPVPVKIARPVTLRFVNPPKPPAVKSRRKRKEIT